MIDHPGPTQVDQLARFEPVLRARARRLIGTRLQHVLGPSDLLQETLLIAVRRFSEISGRPSRQVLTWLLSSMRFRLMHHVRDNREEIVHRENGAGADVSAAAGSTSVGGRIIRDESKVTLLQMIDALPEVERRVVTLLYRQHRTTAQIAEELGRSEGAVRALHQRAVRRLRERFGECL